MNVTIKEKECQGYTESTEDIIKKMSTQMHEALLAFTVDINLINELIQNDPSLLTSQNHQGLVPIQVVATRANTQLINLLSELGSNIELPDHNGKTPVMFACQSGSLYAVHAFYKCGANMKIVDNVGRTLMHYAAGIGAIHIMHYLHETFDLSYRQQDQEGYTPLHMAVWNGNIDAVKYLLKKKCEANVPNNYGTTPLSVAAKNGSSKIARLLILSTNNNLLVTKDGNGWSPIDHAIKGTTSNHQALAVKMANWTSSRLHKTSHLFDLDFWLFYFVMILPGSSLTAAMLTYIYIPYLLLSVPIVLVIIIVGFFGVMSNHRLPHEAGLENPGAFGAFISGLLLTLVCYFSVVFPYLWPGNIFWFVIVAVDYFLILYLFWKLEHTEPGFDNTGKIKNDGTKMTIVDIAAQDSQSPKQYSFCTHCEIVIPERTKHCKLCHRCCNGFDHHCIWLRTCIGKDNHRLFVLFLFLLALDNFLFVRAVVSALISITGSHNPLIILKHGAYYEKYMFFLLICNFLTGLFGTATLIFQLSVVSMRETTYFDSEGRMAFMRKRIRKRTSFIGRLKTLKQFFFNPDVWYNNKVNALLV